MIKLINPFLLKKDNYDCFGCSPNNVHGLRMEFWDNGDSILSFWKPKNYLEGYLRVVHGGIQATMHDEIASWVVYTKCKVSGVTSNLDVKYKKPLVIGDEDVIVKGELYDHNRRFATIKTSISNSEGVIYSIAEVKYFLFSKEDSIDKYQYPGFEAFYPKE